MPSLDPVVVLVAHLAATGFMTGLIWFVQVVHYPLFGFIGAGSFSRYARAHQTRTTWVVGPIMLLELALATVLILVPPPGVRTTWAVAGFVLLIVIWASTMWLQVPRHRELADGFDARTHARLVSTNWIRTLAWSARLSIAAALLLDRSA